MVMVIVKAVAVEGEGTCIGAAFKSVQLIATDFLACALSLSAPWATAAPRAAQHAMCSITMRRVPNSPTAPSVHRF
jgi:hypothetical protein